MYDNLVFSFNYFLAIVKNLAEMRERKEIFEVDSYAILFIFIRYYYTVTLNHAGVFWGHHDE